ncbi:MAG TPA: hypothetical protein VNA17_03590 [Pyrinomonadaceae bacterium]|nr:hypothetical protein [Pyrinomonadaceae bacterium]
MPDEMLNKTRPYMKDVEKHFDDWYKNSPQVRWTISAYALFIRDMMGDKDVVKTKRLLAEATIEKMPFEALGWVLSVLANDTNSTVEVQAIIRHLLNRTTETASTANFITNYGDGAWLIMYSNRRADGVLLEAMIKADAKNDLIPKLVRGLLAHRTKGHWGSTQENVLSCLPSINTSTRLKRSRPTLLPGFGSETRTPAKRLLKADRLIRNSSTSRCRISSIRAGRRISFSTGKEPAGSITGSA